MSGGHIYPRRGVCALRDVSYVYFDNGVSTLRLGAADFDLLATVNMQGNHRGALGLAERYPAFFDLTQDAVAANSAMDESFAWLAGEPQ